MLWFLVSGQVVVVKNEEGTTVGAVETRGLDGVWVGLLLLVGAIDVLGAKLGRAVGSSIGAKEGVKVRSSVGIIVGNLLTGDLLGVIDRALRRQSLCRVSSTAQRRERNCGQQRRLAGGAWVRSGSFRQRLQRRSSRR